MDLSASKYINKDYEYVDYTALPLEQQLEILEWRNDIRIRKLMTTDDVISQADHLNFIQSLKNRSNKKYWLVKKNNNPIGTFNISISDSDPLSCEPGYFLAPDLLDTGIGLDFHYNYKDLLLNVFGFNKLTGYIQVGNNNAFLMAKFFGSHPEAVFAHNGIYYILMSLVKDDFNKIENVKLSLQFTKFYKLNKKIDWEQLVESLKQ